MEEACPYRIDFRWLLEDQKAQDHTTFSRFRTGRRREVVEDLFYQFVKKLEDMSETDHQTVCIDGTKLESAAGRYQTHPKASGEGKGGTGKTNRAQELFCHRFQAGGRTAAYPFRTRERQTQKSAAARMGRTMDAAGTLKSIRMEADHHGRQPQQRFQNRSGRGLHANEGRLHAQRSSQPRV
ncbi:MAG TPA: transposase [Candidatus Limiplasma stercoravium]|nr:transposase [Candidatus Limiplasma stercoravium]